MKYYKQRNRFFRHIPTYPFIFPAVIPMIILDLWIEIFHRISFPLYRIPYVKRRDYIRIDRHKLSYLRLLQKINCVYCGYANGVIRYWAKIISETEKYWCGIQHADPKSFNAPDHHEDFIPYNDEKAFKKAYSSNKTLHNPFRKSAEKI